MIDAYNSALYRIVHGRVMRLGTLASIEVRPREVPRFPNGRRLTKIQKAFLSGLIDTPQAVNFKFLRLRGLPSSIVRGFDAGEVMRFVVGFGDGVARPKVVRGKFVAPRSRTFVAFKGYIQAFGSEQSPFKDQLFSLRVVVATTYPKMYMKVA